MSDLELAGSESSEGGASAEAVEKLREQMRKASAAIKAIQKEEGKQKKKEDKLANLLVKLIQSGGGATSGVLALIVQLLAENIPAGFILAILILSREDIKKEAGEDLMLKNYEDPEQKMIEGEKVDLTKDERKIFKKREKEMEDLEEEEILSPKIRDELNEWGEMILAAGLMNPHKTLGTVLDSEKKIKAPVVQLAAFTLRDYFTMHGLEHDYDDMWDFTAAVLRSVMVKINKASKDVKKEVLPELKI
ncbi:MAG: hypothetical protein WCT46_03405 [Candidatus Gracilibacteria bacterium]|jgi:hypothetical protein